MPEKDVDRFKMLKFKKPLFPMTLILPLRCHKTSHVCYDVKHVMQNKVFLRNAYIVENSMDLAIIKGSYHVPIGEAKDEDFK